MVVVPMLLLLLLVLMLVLMLWVLDIVQVTEVWRLWSILLIEPVFLEIKWVLMLMSSLVWMRVLIRCHRCKHLCHCSTRSSRPEIT